ncbi:type II secretion system protein F [Gordonia sp. SID5947]|uniref:type II secretion system F family protein n=1 Tax=Gordonia sp. SID5947 TaxID=2690315 RepID=UPI00136A23B8|nr:type II secretion system protein F [Gordonia sp. SID5947]MYR08052.1 type II secretion system protein F [Gordonia sp. SID5947]
MIAIIMASAVAVLWWPSTHPQYRIAALTPGSSTRAHTVPWRVCVACGAPVAAIVTVGFHAAVAVTLLSATAMWRWRRTQRVRERERETSDLLLALSVMTAELSVGAPPALACAAAARELGAAHPSSPVAEGLTMMAGRAELGGEVMPDVEADDQLSWRRVGIAWQTADRHGLPMIEMVESVRSDLLARRQFATRTRAGLAGPRATAAVLAGLPIVGILLGELMGAHPTGVLLGGGIGGVLLIVGTTLSVAGLVWSERITDRVINR